MSHRRMLRLLGEDESALRSELDEEFAAHVELRAEALVRGGASPTEARKQAEAELRDLQDYADRIIAEDRMRLERARWLRWVEQVGHDVRQAILGLARQKLWTAGVLFVLALGVAVNAAIFSLVDAVLFRGADAVRPEQLVRVFSPGVGEEEMSGSSYPLYVDYRDQARLLSGVAAISDAAAANVVIDGRMAEQIQVAITSGTYFNVLGTRPAVGRLLAPSDDQRASEPVIVLSHRYWQRAFAGERDITRKRVLLNGEPFTVIGVAPAGFVGITFDQADAWVPLMAANVAAPGLAQLAPLERRGFSWLDVIGRLRPGVSEAQARAELTAIAGSSAQTAERRLEARLVPARDAMLEPADAAPAAMLSWLLLGTVLLVLLLACADVAALLLARAELRRRDLAVRLALGAGRSRLMQQLAIESLMIAAGAAVLGFALANILRRAVIAFAPADFPLPLLAATPLLDARVVAFTASIALASALLFGLLPMIAVTRVDVAALRGSIGALYLGRTRIAVRDALVVVQLALSLVFLTGAALLGRSIRNATALDLGFARAGVITGRIDLSRNRYDRTRGEAFFEALLERLRATPGVESVALAYHPTVRNSGIRTSAEFEGHVYPKDADIPSIDVNLVTPGYLKTVGSPLLRGRDFTDADVRTSTQVVLVSDALARQYWPGQDPIGKRIGALSDPPAEVIGVVANAKYRTLREAPLAFVLRPLSQMYVTPMSVVMRSGLSRSAAQRAIEQAVAELDPAVPVYDIATVQERLRDAFGQERLIALLLTGMSLLGLLLSATGLFALISFVVRSRRREWGIRMAVGAQPGDVVRGIQLRSIRLALAGLAIGVVGALVLTRYLQSLLLGVSHTDPLSYAGAAGLLFIVALMAGYLPARRATRTDPTVALRAE